MRILILITILLGFLTARGSGDYIFVDTISIEGNQRTKNEIILRELKFSSGDTIQVEKLGEVLDVSEKLVMNTGLFSRVKISFRNWEGSTGRVHIHILVEETWYIFPVPVFELADRNFNVWWVEQNRSLQRINFGLEFTHLNFTGHRDRVKMKIEYGYTRSYSLAYQMPFVNRSKTLGLSGDVSYSRNREINYLTLDNKQEFFKDDDRFIYQRFHTLVGLHYRPGLMIHHDFLAVYRQNRISEQVAEELNPNFFLNGRRQQRYFSLAYRFVHDTRDVRPYPLRGHRFEVLVEKDGLGIFGDRNALTLRTRIDRYLPLSRRWNLGLGASGKLSLIRDRQPYNDNRAIGFGQNSLHGYEYYIVDGLDMAMLKSALRFKLADKELRFGKIVPIDAYRRMPVKIFLALNNDIGYANDPFEKEANFLNNRLLWGGGLGVDIILFYDKVIQIEYSFNHLLENGLFLHLNMNI